MGDMACDKSLGSAGLDKSATFSAEAVPASDTERRRFSRVHFDATARLLQGGLAFDTAICDVSLNGVLLKTPEHYQLRSDQPCTLEASLSEGVVIQFQAMLIHASDRTLGLQIISIDMDSITHLRRLIEVNLGDSQAAERVLSELVAATRL
jgi:hypothetical protein